MDVVSPLQTNAKAIMATAAVSGEIDGADGAFPNLKYDYARRIVVKLEDDAGGRGMIHCGNHTTHLNDVNLEKLLFGHGKGLGWQYCRVYSHSSDQAVFLFV